MYSNFKEKAIGAACLGPAAAACLLLRAWLQGINTQLAGAEYVKEAVQEDNAGNYQKAFDLYKIALEYFSTHLKYEKNPRAKEAITAKVRCKFFLGFLTACLGTSYCLEFGARLLVVLCAPRWCLSRHPRASRCSMRWPPVQGVPGAGGVHKGRDRWPAAG